MEGYNKLRRLLITWLLGNGLEEKEATEFADSLIALRKAEVEREKMKHANYYRRHFKEFVGELRENLVVEAF